MGVVAAMRTTRSRAAHAVPAEPAAAPTAAPPVGKTDPVRSVLGFESVARRTSSVTRWVRSLSRHQAHELNAIVWWLCVCAFIIVNQPGLLRFRTTCDASRAFQKHLAAVVFSFEAWASWGTPKGRGAHAAYSRRAARRQTWLLILLCFPAWIMNLAACHDPITLPGARERGERLGKLAVWIVIAFGFRHSITSARGRLPLGIMTINFMCECIGQKVTEHFVGLYLLEVIPRTAVVELIARFFEERDRAYYGGLAARGDALVIPGVDDVPSRAKHG